MDYPISLFIDTNYFISIKFEFSKGEVKSLIEHCQAGRIKLYTSDIVINEVEKHIKEDIANALSNIRNEIKKENRLVSIMNKEQYKFLFQDIRKIGIVEEILADYRQFIEDTRCDFIDYSSINPRIIFDKYFAKEAPFGKGDKKAEFPDAFMIEAIKSISSDKKFLIVSQDNDWKKAFDGSDIIVLDGINSIVSDINKDVYSEKYDETLRYIETEEFTKLFDTNLVSEMYNIFVDVEEVIDTLDITDVQLIGYKFVGIDYIFSDTIELSFLVNADITVEYTYFDEENSVYDTVDHEYIYQHTAEVNEVHMVGIEVTVRLETNDDLNNLVIVYDSIIINDNKLFLDDKSLKERTRTDNEEPFSGYYDFQLELVGDSSESNDLMDCPDCGRKFDYRNDGGNGFCSECGPDH